MEPETAAHLSPIYTAAALLLTAVHRTGAVKQLTACSYDMLLAAYEVRILYQPYRTEPHTLYRVHE